MSYSFTNWLKKMKSSLIGSRRNQRRSAVRTVRRVRPNLELLEEREVPATLYVGPVAMFSIDTDIGAPGLSAGDSVTWNPGAGNSFTGGGSIAGLTFGTDAFTSLASAVTAANLAVGPDTVNVGPGTYTENFSITGALTLRGAQFGVDARGRVATESILTPAAPATPTAFLGAGVAGSIIDGFTFSGGARAIESNGGPLTNLQILNNRIIGFTNAGVFLNDSGADITVDKNVIDGTSKTGGGGLFHLDTDAFFGFYLTNNNIVNGTTGTGFFVDGNHNVAPSGARTPLISGNLIDNNATGMNLGTRAFGLQFTPNAGTISNNTFSNSGFDGLQGGMQNVLITQNTFTGNDRWGLALTAFGNLGADRGAQNNVITENFFSNNTGLPASGDVLFSTSQLDANNATNALFNNSLTSAVGVSYSGTQTIQASGNWWGNISGPTVSTNPGGTGSSIAGTSAANVDFSPWLDSGTDQLPATAGFQGSLSALHVEDTSAHSTKLYDSILVMPAGRIQEGVALLADGILTGANRTVTADAGIYSENVTVAKSLQLIGAGTGSTTINAGGGVGVALSGGANTNTLQALAITGGSSALTSTGLTTLNLNNVASSGNTSGGSLTGTTGTVNVTAAAAVSASADASAQNFGTGDLQTISYAGSTLSNLNLGTLGNNNAFSVKPVTAGTTTIAVNGGLPFPSGNTSTLALDLTAVTSPTINPTGPGAGNLTTVPAATPLSWTNIATLSSTPPAPVVITLTATNNYRVYRTGPGNVNLEVEDVTASTVIYSATYASITTLTLNGVSGGSNSVTLDFTGSTNAIPTGGFTFNGGLGGNDKLFLVDGTTTTQTFNFTNENDGSVVLAGAIAGTAAYTGLEPVVSSVNAANVVLDYSTVTEVITVSQDGGDTTKTKVDSNVGGESVSFVNPTVSLQINGGDTGDDTITVNSFGTSTGGFNASLSITGGTGNDTVNLNTALVLGSTTSAGDLSVTAETINLGANINTDNDTTNNDAGTVSLTGGVLLGAAITIDTDATTTDASITFGTGSSINNAQALVLNAGSANIVLNNTSIGGTTPLTSLSTTSGDVNGSGNIATVSGVTVTNTGAASTLSGVISGAAATLTKSGAGTLTLSNASNTYGGTTTISNGTLALAAASTNNIASSSTIDVQTGTFLDVTGLTSSTIVLPNGQTLKGNGTVTGSTSATSGSTVSPGASPGKLNTGNVAFASGANFNVELNGTTVASGYDQLDVTGTVSLGGSNLNVSLGASAPVGQKYVIINNDLLEAVTGTFAGLPEGTVFTVTTGPITRTFRITYEGGTDDNDVVLEALGHFQFLGSPTAPVQANYTTVLPDRLYTGGYGWLSLPTDLNFEFDGGFVRTNSSSSPLANLLKGGHFDVAGAGGSRTFQADVVNGTYQVSVKMGDLAFNRDNMVVKNGDTNVVLATGINTVAGQVATRTFTITVSDGTLNLNFSDLGGDPYWVVNGLNIWPVDVPVVAFAPQGPLLADGLTVDNIPVAGFTPNAEVTVSTNLGTIASADVDASIAGVQLLTNGTGQATVSVLRATSAGVATVQFEEVTGAKIGSGQITYVLPTGRRFDFNTATSPTQATFLGVKTTDAYTATNAFGWIGTAPTSFDRTFSGPPAANMLKDGVFGNSSPSGFATFRADLPNGTYQVTVTQGDALYARDKMNVAVVVGTGAGLTNIASPAGQFASNSFTVTTSGGQFQLKFSDGGGDPNWVLNGLEIRAIADVIPISLIGPGGSLVADGTTVEVINGSGATPNAYVTVSTTMGTITAADVNSTYAGVQVLTDGSGNFSFTVRRAHNIAGTATVTAHEINGASVGNTSLIFVLPATRRFDIGTSGSPVAAGFAQSQTTDTLATKGIGWVTPGGVTAFDTGSGGAQTTTALYRDFVYGNTQQTLQIAATVGTTYSIRLYVGDSRVSPHGAYSMQVRAYDSLAVPGAFTTVTTTAGGFNTVVLTGVVGASGIINVDIKATTPGKYWTLNGIDVWDQGGLNDPGVAP